MDANFNFPRVTVTQNFSGAGTGAAAVLPAVIIGAHYDVLSYDDNGEDIRLDATGTTGYVAGTGLTDRSYPGLSSAGVVDEESVKVYVRDAHVEYHAATTATLDTGSLNRIVFAGPIATGNGGTRGATVYTNAEAGDIVYITLDSGGVAMSTIAGLDKGVDDYYTIAVLSSSLPAGTVSADMQSVKLCKSLNVYLRDADLTHDTNSIAIAAATVSIVNTEGSSVASRPVLAGKFYSEYRQRLSTYVNQLGWIVGGTDCQAAIEDVVGAITPDNPVALALSYAGKSAGNKFVAFTTVAEDTVEAYTDAMDFIGKYNTVYGIVPATSNAAIIAAVHAAATAQSSLEVPNFRYTYGSLDTPTYASVLTGITVGSVLTGVITVAGTSPLFNKGIAVGDVIRMTYSTDIFGNETFVQHTITATDYETTLTVADTTIAPAATSRLEIWRPVTTNAQRVAALVAAKAVANKGCLFAYADGVQYNGVDVPNYCVAAAIAGTRCAYVPHKPLSNVAIPAVITTEQHGYSLSNLKTLGANGIWLVGESEDGVVISRKQVTSAATGDINYDEQSLTTNVDSICIALKNVGKEYVGNSNISPDLITLLQAQMTTTMDSFLISADGKAGPQLLSYEILSLAQDTVNKDRVYCRLSGTPPKPFNEFNIGFYLN